MGETPGTDLQVSPDPPNAAMADLRPRLLESRSTRAVMIFFAVVAVVAPFLLSRPFQPPLDFPWSSWFHVVNVALVASAAAVAFNVMIGYIHQVSIAQVAFLIVGTMSAAAFGQLWGLPFPLVVLLAGVMGAIVGIIVGLPALRLRGLYLLVATLGVHFIALFIFRRFELRYFGFGTVTFGEPTLPKWMNSLPLITPDEGGQFVIRGDFRWYWFNLAFAVFTISYMANMLRFREGRAFLAVRDQDVAAALSGIDVARTKLRAFAVSSAVVSMCGAVSAYSLGSRTSDSFTLEIALQYAIMIVVGGLATVSGGIVGAFVFFLAPVFLTWIRRLAIFEDIDVVQRYGNEIDLALFGVLVIVVLVTRPSGVVGMATDIKRRLVGRR